MIKKIMLLVVVSSFISNIYGQKSASDYSYVVVPELYEFLFEEDQHQLNSMTKFLFNKYGFNAYFPSELPNVKRCDGLQAEVIGKPSFTYTKITIILKDCYGEEIFRSEEGRSKYKEYKKSYQDALRKAFVSVAELEVNQKEIITYKDNKTNQPDDPSVDVIDEMQSPDENINEERASIGVASGTTVMAVAIANLPEDKFTSYELDGKSYLLRKTSEGYSFYEESENASNGLLLKGSIMVKGSSAVYTSSEGKEFDAGFNANGDLIIESSGSLIRYKVQD
jgi:hypothetical protein